MQISKDGCILHLSEHHGDCTPGAAIRIEATGLEAFQRELAAKGYSYGTCVDTRSLRQPVDLHQRRQHPVNIHQNPSALQVGQLLAACDLPASDLSPEHLQHFFVCGAGDAPQSAVGVELYGRVALLRSLAVAADYRGMGCGRALVAKAERYARLRGVAELYLLTTTAGRFFERLGYAPVPRESAPAEIRRTREFSALCPSSAAFMLKALRTASS